MEVYPLSIQCKTNSIVIVTNTKMANTFQRSLSEYRHAYKLLTQAEINTEGQKIQINKTVLKKE